MGKQNLYEHVKPPLVVAGPGVPHGKSAALVYLFEFISDDLRLCRSNSSGRHRRSKSARNRVWAAGTRSRVVAGRLPRMPSE